MKFSIRYADQIVGFLVILALAILIFVVIMLGKSQRWFSRDNQYKTYFNSAAGLSPNMAIQYRGFSIGTVKSIKLSEDDRVEVIFTIFEEHSHRVKEGSLVEVQSSPLGSGFMFHPGVGTELVPEGSVIPEVSSPEARRLLVSGLAVRADSGDSISAIINQVNTLLASLNETLPLVNEALAGTDRTALGRTLGNVELITSTLPDELVKIINGVLSQIDPLLADVQKITGQLSEPSGTVMSILDSKGPVYTDLVAALDSVTAIIKNLEKTTDFIPAQLPQITLLLYDVQSALKTAEDLMIAVTNNPLLKGGAPQHQESGPGAANPRNINF